MGSFWKWWGCRLAEASRPNGLEATRSNIALRKWGSQDNNWGDVCCFQSIKPKLSHRVIKLNSTDFCIIIVIIYHLNYWSTLRRQLKWEQRELLLYKDIMGVCQSGWAHRLKRNGVSISICSVCQLTLRGRPCTLISERLLSIWEKFKAPSIADGNRVQSSSLTQVCRAAWSSRFRLSCCTIAHQSLHLSHASSERSFLISVKSLATACFIQPLSQHPVLSTEKLTHPLACQLGSVQMRQESSPSPVPLCWAHTNCHL